VDPVVEGMARASQDTRNQPGPPSQDRNRSLVIALHGDAAFPGQGIVAETLNLSGLPGYTTGGTIHIIVNNQIGFTTDSRDSRSTLYAGDLAKGFEIPVVHVNADDPVSCLAAARLATAYRQQFGKDFLIDLVGYRRWGHNEGDEPGFTQPQMYKRVTSHPTVREVFAKQLDGEGVVSAADAESMLQQVLDNLASIRKQVIEAGGAGTTHDELGRSGHTETIQTGVAGEKLRAYDAAIHSLPQDVKLSTKLQRQWERRGAVLGQPDGKIDWAHGEALAFASIIADGTPIRLTGQDSERGTFSQRHLVLHDADSGKRWVALQELPQATASFAVYNSPLSEMAAMGFEYGYTVHAPDALVLWEAQFGDFANSAQVIIDQFLVAGEDKWRRLSGLGYDNIELRLGDGTLGWPEAAPFDAILVAAAGSEVPDPLLAQLRTGGVLVMPRGAPDEVQKLVRLRSQGGGSFDQEELGSVRFVPLVEGLPESASGEDASPRA